MSDFNDMARQLLGTPSMTRQQFIDAAVLAMVAKYGIEQNPVNYMREAINLADARERYMKGAKDE